MPLQQQHQCLTATKVAHEADAVICQEVAGRQSFITSVNKLDTDKTVVDEKRVQRSDGHFDLLGMQIFLYKGRMSPNRYSDFLNYRATLC